MKDYDMDIYIHYKSNTFILSVHTNFYQTYKNPIVIDT